MRHDISTDIFVMHGNALGVFPIDLTLCLLYLDFQNQFVFTLKGLNSVV